MLFATTGNLGHFLPQVPLARALAEAGHEVRVSAPRSFAEQVTAAGLDPVPFGEPSRAAVGRVFAEMAGLSVQEADRRVLRDVFGHLDGGAALSGVVDAVRTWRPQLVVRDPAELASLAAAEAEGVPHAVAAIALDTFVDEVAPDVAEPLDVLADRVGLAGASLLEALRTAPSFTTLPASFDPVAVPAPRAVERYRAVAAPAAPAAGTQLPPWGRPDDPLVYVSLGSVAGTMPGTADTFAAMLGALAPLEVRVLLTVGRGVDPDGLRPWPANARVVRWWDQAAVMPHAAVVVGHGGFGTTTAALAAGVPQVAVPLFSTDQWANARRLAEIGAGVLVTTDDTFREQLAAGVRRVLSDPALRAVARGLAADMAALPPASAMVGRLEALASAA